MVEGFTGVRLRIEDVGGEAHPEDPEDGRVQQRLGHHLRADALLRGRPRAERKADAGARGT